MKTDPVNAITSLLSRYHMTPYLLSEMVIDQAIASIHCTADEQALACQQFYQKRRIADHQTWLEQHGVTSELLADIVTRKLKISKFQRATWKNKLESYFHAHKQQLDQVIYALIQVEDAGLAQELYFRLKEGEQSFAELAQTYSQGPEAETGGLVGPIELGNVSQNLAPLLLMSHPGELWPPMPMEESLLIIRLEKLIPAQMNESMRQRLYQELFDTWVIEQSKQLSYKMIVLQKLAEHDSGAAAPIGDRPLAMSNRPTQKARKRANASLT